MRVPQEKCEPYTEDFVSANMHRYVGQVMPYFTNISDAHIFLFFENMLNFWQGVYIGFTSEPLVTPSSVDSLLIHLNCCTRMY